MKLKLFFSLSIFIVVYLTHSKSSVINSIDSMWVMHSAHSIVNQGNLNLNEFRKEVRLKDKYGVRKRNNNIYNYFPYGTPLIAAPFVYIFDLAPEFFVKFVPLTDDAKEKVAAKGKKLRSLTVRLSLERAIASVIVALTTALIFLIACNFLTTTRAVILSLIFAFTTPAWSVLSRGLWQHGPSVLMHVLALLCMVRADLAGDGTARLHFGRCDDHRRAGCDGGAE